MEALSIEKLAKTAEYLQLEQHFGTEIKIGFQIQIIMALRDKKIVLSYQVQLWNEGLNG